MHIHKAGHQEPTVSIDSPSVLRDPDTSSRPDGNDTSAADDYRAVGQNAIGVHRHDVDVDEGDRAPRFTLGLSINGPRQTED